MTVFDSELDIQSNVAVAYLLSIVIKKSVICFFDVLFMKSIDFFHWQ